MKRPSNGNCSRSRALNKNIACASAYFWFSAKQSACRFKNESNRKGFGRMGTRAMGGRKAGKDDERRKVRNVGSQGETGGSGGM
jgi:hypothetical protein